jgi:hypothetical protein
LQLNEEPAEASLPNVPLGHKMQALDCAREYEPAEHGAQEVSPLEAVIKPAEHGEQAEDPAEPEKVPAGHCRQEATEVAARYWLYLPDKQRVHDVCPR